MCDCNECSSQNNNNAEHRATATTVKPRLDPLSVAFEPLGISPRRQNLSRQVVARFMGTLRFISRHWLTLLNTMNFGLVLLAFAAPVFSSWGWNWLSNSTYGLTHVVCVQNPNHSFYLDGQQMALCQRCLAIYAVLGLLGLLFHLVRRRVQPLKFWQFVAFSLPILLDGFTQLFGWRESTWELRFISGAFFAFGTIWYMYPQFERGMQKLRHKLSLRTQEAGV